MSFAAILSLARRFWWAPVILALVIGLLWYRGSLHEALRERQAEQRAHEITVSNYRTAALEREKSDLVNISRVKGETDAISTATVGDYQARIDQLRADFAARVRTEAATGQRSAANSAVPVVSDGPSGTDARACEATLLSKDALIASEQAEQLIALQAWIRKTSAIDVNGEPPR